MSIFGTISRYLRPHCANETCDGHDLYKDEYKVYSPDCPEVISEISYGVAKGRILIRFVEKYKRLSESEYLWKLESVESEAVPLEGTQINLLYDSQEEIHRKLSLHCK